MAHVHSFSVQDTRAKRSLLLALQATGVFMVVEFIGGWLSNSLALLSDAAHMLTDFLGLGLSLFAAWLATRPSSPKVSFGYQRAEILVALVSGLSIWLLTGMLLVEAVDRLMDPAPVKAPWVIGIGGAGMLVNLYCMFVLKKGTHGKNLNVRAAYLHVMGDLLGSVCAIASGIVILKTGWFVIDPILTFVVGGILLYSSWKLVKEAIGVLMEMAPRDVHPEKIQNELAALKSVQGVHDLHVWAVTSGKSALSVHLISSEGDQALKDAQQVLDQNHGIHHTTIQVEHPDRFDSSRCFDCASS